MTDIAALQSEILGQVVSAQDEAQLEAVRVAALGKKGSVSALLATMGSLSPDERKVQGPKFNGLKDAVAEAIALRKSQLADQALEARLTSEKQDVTLPAQPENSGTIHPISQVLEEVVAIFADLASVSPKARTWNMTITTSPN
jgi:phenylalanyl-tRNA synthetase alpha chain